jgi:ribosomal protein S6--L-glutamate ligase/tetrahydromethanopterin:alpha-L-glutamate ligase
VASVEPEGWETSRLIEAIRKRGVYPLVFDVSQTVVRVGKGKRYFEYHKNDLTKLDGILTRAVPGGSLEQVILRMDVLHCLERMGIPFMNTPASIEKAVDKYYTLRLLEMDGVPVPRTVVTQNAYDALRAFRQFGDAVVKPLFGSGGVGMTRVSDPEVARRVFRALEASRYVMYVQEYLEHGDRDIRVFVLGGVAIAAMYRVSTGWKISVRQGARPEPCKLTPALSQLAGKCATAIGLEYAGVDILESDQGLMVTEVNSSSGWQGLQQVTDFDIADRILDRFFHIIGHAHS